MRILFYGPIFYSLHSQIIEELQLMGHTVGFIPDKIYRFDPRFKSNPLNFIKRGLSFLFDSKKDIIRGNEELLKQSWDVLLCINGYSYNKEINRIIKRYNPNIRSILYLWDSLNFYDFSKNFKFFDKIISFDPEDCKTYKLIFKPLFYCKNDLSSESKTDIDLSFIGSQHTIRYRVLSELKRQLSKTNLKYRFYLVVNNKKITLIDKLKYLFYYFSTTSSAIAFKDEYLIKKGKIIDDIVRFSPLPADKVADIMNRSKCIVDIAKPDQNGFTNRMIEALGRKKKIITNIKSVKDTSINSSIIQYIDDINPRINIDFLNKDAKESDFNPYKELRIDKWLNSILKE